MEDPLSSQEQQYLRSHELLFAKKRKSPAFERQIIGDELLDADFFPLYWLSSQSMCDAPRGIATAFQTPQSKQLSLSWVAVGESTSAAWTERERGSAVGTPDDVGHLTTWEFCQLDGEGIACL